MTASPWHLSARTGAASEAGSGEVESLVGKHSGRASQAGEVREAGGRKEHPSEPDSQFHPGCPQKCAGCSCGNLRGS